MSAQIFVANLDFNSVTDSDLFQLFSRYVEVQSATIARDADGRSRGFGFVKLFNDDEVETALQLDRYLFHERRIGVERSRNKKEKNGPSSLL